MSIRPEFASAIFAGEKHFEFRRTTFKRPVDVVVVYVTAPVQSVVGEFDVAEVIREPVDDLWERAQGRAGIDRARFFDYFDGVENGYAIRVGELRKYEEPLALDAHFGVKPPQSFMYLDFPWPVQPPLEEV